MRDQIAMEEKNLQSKGPKRFECTLCGVRWPFVFKGRQADFAPNIMCVSIIRDSIVLECPFFHTALT